MEKFTKNDLKPGHVVQFRNGEYRMVMPVGKDTLVLVRGFGDKKWDYLSRWDDNLLAIGKRFEFGYFSRRGISEAKELDIVAVYGFVQGADNYDCVGDLSEKNRPVLFSRRPVKRMTVAEINEALGYDVEIIAEK